jgi:MFS family permease
MDKSFIKFTVGIFLISLASLTFEVALSYEYAFMFWFAVSFIVITIAMFGLGMGSVFGYFHFRRKPEKYRESLYSASIGLGIAMASALAVTAFLSRSSSFSRTAGVGFDLGYALGVLMILAAAVVPFVFAGFILSMGLSYPEGDRKRISYIYFADLIGAGIGSFLITAFLPFTGVEKVILLCSLLSLLAAPMFLKKSFRAGLALPLVFITLLLVLPAGNYLMPEPSGDKFLRKLKERGADVLHTEWTAVSRVDVVKYRGSELIRFIENAEYPITVTHGNPESPGVAKDPRYMMFFFKPKSMLAIGSGGGVEVTMALRAGVERIVGAEINPFVVEYMTNDLHEYSRGIYSRPGVEVFIEDGRTLVHRIRESFDLIENGVLGSSGLVVPSTSVLAFQDAYVYTIEANMDYWNRMSPRGVTVTIIYGLLDDYNSVDASRGVTYLLLRQYYTVREALLRAGVEPEKHMMFFRYEQAAGNLQEATAQAEYTFIFKEPLTESRVRALILEAEKYGLEALYAPYYPGSIDFDSYAASLPPERDVSPAVDDRPFFYFTYAGVPREMYLFLALLIAATYMFIILPIAKRQRLALDRSSAVLLIYFTCLGIGYILVEVTLIQKLVLFLGQPRYAFQVVLFSMLVFSGIGSFWTGYAIRRNIFHPLRRVLVLIVTGIALAAYLLPVMIYGSMHLDTWLKVVLSIVFLAPLAFIMGMPFPLGLRIVSTLGKENVVWMFGLNASGSVLGSVIAMMVAMSMGFSYVLALGAGVYLVGLASVYILGRRVMT